MRLPFIMTLVLGTLCSLSVISVPQAAERKITVAPAEYLKMESPINMEDVDDAFFKRTKRVYKRKCKKCHGTEGDGKGSATADMVIKPSAFNKPSYLKGIKDGQLYWILAKGSKDTEMEGYGPGTDVGMSEKELWKLIAYLRFNFTK